MASSSCCPAAGWRWSGGGEAPSSSLIDARPPRIRSEATKIRQVRLAEELLGRGSYLQRLTGRWMGEVGVPPCLLLLALPPAVHSSTLVHKGHALALQGLPSEYGRLMALCFRSYSLW